MKLPAFSFLLKQISISERAKMLPYRIVFLGGAGGGGGGGGLDNLEFKTLSLKPFAQSTVQ